VTLELVTDSYGQVILPLDQFQQSSGALLGNVDISPKNNQLGQFARVSAKLNPIVGLLYRSYSGRFRAGLTYRAEAFLDDSATNDMLLKIRPNEEAGGFQIPLMLSVTGRSVRYYQPAELAGGFAFYPVERVLVSMDVTWMDWSGYESQITTPVSYQLVTIDPDFQDTIVPRLGVQVEIFPPFTVTAGYNYQESPVPNHPGYVTYVDTDRHVFCLGLELAYSGIRLQGYFQYQWAVKRDFNKYPAYGEDFSAGGKVFSFGFNLSGAF